MDRSNSDRAWLIRSRAFVGLVVLFLPVLLYALLHAKLGAAEVYKWLPHENQDKAAYLRFLEDFGGDQVMMVSWDGLSLDDKRVEGFLKAIESFQSQHGEDSLIDRVETTAAVFEKLSAPPLSFSSALLEKRFEGNLIGPNGRCAIWVYFQNQALQSPELAVQALWDISDQVDGLAPAQLKLVGALFESYCIDRSIEEALLRFVPLSSLLAVVVAWVLLRSIPNALVALSLAGIGQLIPVAIVFYSGDRFSAVQTMLPTLVFVLTLSSLIHLIKYASHVEVSSREYTGVGAVRVGLKPCLWASGTTVLAMLSLAFSQLAPIRLFGYYSAASLGIATLVILGMFPAVYEFLSRFERKHRLLLPSPDGFGHGHGGPANLHHPLAAKFVRTVTPLRTPIFIVSLIGIIGGMYSLERLQVGTIFSTMYPKNHPFIQDVGWIEKEIGNVIPVEVIVEIKQDESLSLISQLLLIEDLVEQLKSIEEVGAVSSVLDYLPEIPKSSSIGATARRVVMNRKLREAFEASLSDEAMKNPMAAVEGNRIRWRIMARVSAFSNRFNDTLEGMKKKTTRFEQQLSERNIEHRIDITGVMQLAYSSQSIMGRDFLGGMAGALILLSLLMIWHARSLGTGLCYMLPNILPVVLTLGSMAWLGVPIDMGGVLCSTIALGIAVDDTLHLTSYYQNLRKAKIEPTEAITRALGACGPAMAITTATTCFSFAPFLLADFTPIQQFAWVCMVMLIIAWLGDMILLTPLLSSKRR